MPDYTQIESIIGMLKRMNHAIRVSALHKEDLNNIQLTIQEINQELYNVRMLRFQGKYHLENKESQYLFADELDKLISVWEQSILRGKSREPDNGFWEIYEYFKYVDKETIFAQALVFFKNLPEGTKIEYLSLPYRYPYLCGKMDFVEKDFSLLRECIDLIFDNLEQYRWLYERLEDNCSKRILNAILKFWYTFDEEGIRLLKTLNTNKCHDSDQPVKEGIVLMDTKETEMDVIKKEREEIRLNKPKMILPLWHRLNDLFKIPRAVYEIRKDYKFYLEIQFQEEIWPSYYMLYVE